MRHAETATIHYEPQNHPQHFPVDGDFGHLEGVIATVDHHLRADVISFSFRPVSDRP